MLRHTHLTFSIFFKATFFGGIHWLSAVIQQESNLALLLDENSLQQMRYIHQKPNYPILSKGHKNEGCEKRKIKVSL